MKSILVIFTLLALPTLCLAEENNENSGVSYVDGSKSFLKIDDVNRQAETWAMCAAVYDFMAEVLSEDQPANSQYLADLANGAEIAVGMTLVSDGLEPDITSKKFNALWTMAKLAITELPKTRRTMLAAEAELISNEVESTTFMANIVETSKVCIQNLEGQQFYIDLWRELAKSGLLKLPTN